MAKIKNGFTLIELLVVISIIALLLSVLMPALSKARGAARRVICMSNQKQIAMAAVAYAAANKDTTPMLRYNWNNNPNMPIDQRQVYGNFIRWMDLDVWLGPGLLYKHNYIADGKVMYCPFVPSNTVMSWENQWKAVTQNLPQIVQCTYFLTLPRKMSRWKTFATSVDFCEYGNPLFDDPSKYPDVVSGFSHFKLAKSGRVGELTVSYSDGSVKGIEDTDAIFAGTAKKPFVGSPKWQNSWRCYVPSLIITRILFYSVLDPSYQNNAFNFKDIPAETLRKLDIPD